MNVNETNENVTMTDDQVKQVWTTLSAEDADSTNKLENAEIETIKHPYDGIDEMVTGQLSSFVPGVTEETAGDPTPIDDSQLKEVMDEYNLTTEEVTKMIDLVDRYRKSLHDVKMQFFYDELPKPFKDIADGIVRAGKMQGMRISKNGAAYEVLNQVLHDAQFVAVMDQFKSEVNDAAIQINKEYNKMFADAFEDIFTNIDKIAEENPDKAKQLMEIKKAFEDSLSYDKLKETADKFTANKLNKIATRRFDNEAIYFNNKINVTDVKVPDVRELLPIISNNLPQYSIDDIKKFIIVLCKSVIDIDFKNDIAGLAYAYKLIHNIFIFKYLEKDSYEEAATLFGKIAEVIDYISSKK